MMQPHAQAALIRGVHKLIDEKKLAANGLREISKELAAGALTAEAALRLANRLRGIEHLLLMGRR